MKLIINTFDSLKRRMASAVSMLAIAFGSFLPGSVTVHAQTPQVNESGFSGVVVDTDGSPLPGAGVMVKGTSEGTVTDNDGRWGLDAGENAVLEVSSLGFETVELRLGKQRSGIKVVLREDSKQLDEVVVVGYGFQARKTLTTSISKVDGSALMDAPVTSVGDAIKGKVPGLRVATSNSLSGEAPRFMIRGGSSISMSNDPIYIVDGALRDDMNGINPVSYTHLTLPTI